MKFKLLCFALFLFPALGEAQNTVSVSRLFDGTEYQFHLSDSELDKSPVWQTADPVPALDPRKASRLAKDFLDKLTKGKTSLGGKQIIWDLSSITLHKISYQPERWIYKIDFGQDVSAYGSWTGPVEHFEVIVYLTGTIVSPTVSAKDSQ